MHRKFASCLGVNLTNEYWYNIRFRSTYNCNFFYIILNIPYWLLLWNKRKSENIVEDKKYHHWAYTSDDSMNKILKFCMYCLYGYGAYVFIAEMWTKYT